MRELELASWLPIADGLTPHGMRHSHRVCIDEIGTSAFLAHDRLGHSMPGIGGTYALCLPGHAEALRARLQARWETALDERLASLADVAGAGPERAARRPAGDTRS